MRYEVWVARVVVTSGCYLGDVAPYVEPAKRLVERGHDVTYLAAAGFHDVLAGQGFALQTYALDFSARAMHADAGHQRLMRHPFLNQARLARYWMRAGFVAEPGAARANLLAAIDGADVVVTHPTFGQVVIPVADSLGVPSVVGHLFPMLIPTADRTPPAGYPGVNMGRQLNRAGWKFLAAASGLAMYEGVINEHRRALGRPALRGNALLGWTEATRTVTLVSPHYLGDVPSDWQGGDLVGFSHWHGPPQPLDPGVEEFLDAGDPPVLVCLGTSAASAAADTFRAIAEAVDRLGLRALLLVGHEANVTALGRRPGVFSFAPLRAVLPRCRAAVVSGGLGTLAAALAAGVPVVVVPQLFDQVWHGARVQALGVGVMALRTSRVRRALATIETNPDYHRRAADLAAAMATDDAPAGLVSTVESLAGAST